jgi:hypothetical protein
MRGSIAAISRMMIANVRDASASKGISDIGVIG